MSFGVNSSIFEKIKGVNFMKKISFRIITAIISCSVIISLLVGMTSIIRSNSVVTDEAKEKLMFLAKDEASKIDRDIVSVQNSVDNLNRILVNTLDIDRVKTDPNYILEYEETLKPIVKSTAEGTTGSMGAYVVIDPSLTGIEHGAWYADVELSGNYKPQKLTKASEYNPDNPAMIWYYATVNAKKGTWTDPYINGENNVNMISYTAPVYNGNVLIGVVGMDVPFDKFKEQILGIKVYKTGDAFLLNSNYNFTVSSTYTNQENFSEVENGFFKPYIEKMKKAPSGVVSWEFDGVKKLAGYSQLSNGSVIVVTVPQQEVLEELRKLVLLIFSIIVLGIVLGLVIAIFIGKRISTPITKVTNLINKTENFDLANDNSFDKLLVLKDETGIMANSMVNMRKSLRTLVEKLSGIIDASSKNAHTVNELVKGIQEDINETSATTEELSAGMEETAASTEEVTATVQEVESALNSIVEKVEEGVAFSDEIAKRAEGLTQQSGKAIAEGTAIYKNVKVNLEKAISQAKSVEQINVLAKSILDITSQTNLLALNAAIEAARAGDAGKGFSVVADEIRKLAEQSASTATEIQNIIEVVNLSVNSLSKGAGDILKFLEEKVSVDYNSFGKMGEQYSKDASTLNSMMTDFSATSEELSASVSNISTAITEIARTIGEASSGVENIAHRMSGITQGVDNIAKSTDGNTKSSGELKDMISKFKM